MNPFKRKTWQLILMVALILAISLNAGCTRKPETPREALQRSIEKTEPITTSETETRVLMQVQMDSDQLPNHQWESLKGFLQHFRLQVKTTSDRSANTSLLEGHVETGGVLLNFELFATDEVLALRVPALTTLLRQPRFQHSYILVETETLFGDMSPEEHSLFREMLNRFATEEDALSLNRMVWTAFLEALADEVLEDLGETTIDIGKGQEKVRQIAIHLGEVEIKAMAFQWVELLRDHEFRDRLFQFQGSDDPGLERNAFDDQMDQAVEELPPLIEEGVTSFFSMMDPEESTLVLHLFLTSDHQVVRREFEGRLRLSPEPGASLQVHMEVVHDTISQNEPVTIALPELTPENTMDLMELVFMMMFGM